MHVYPSEAYVISMPAVNLSAQCGALHCNTHTRSAEYLALIRKKCSNSNKSFIIW